jgi:glucose-6-phosphate 1-dehydrogenase
MGRLQILEGQLRESYGSSSTRTRANPATGYERLLLDCMVGDQTLFQRADMVETGGA